MQLFTFGISTQTHFRAAMNLFPAVSYWNILLLLLYILKCAPSNSVFDLLYNETFYLRGFTSHRLFLFNLYYQLLFSPYDFCFTVAANLYLILKYLIFPIQTTVAAVSSSVTSNVCSSLFTALF